MNPVLKRKRTPSITQAVTPDPSSYSMRPSTSTGVKIGTEARPDVVRNRSPGPASYNV